MAGVGSSLRLDNTINVLLPSDDPATAWADLARLQRTNAILQRDVQAIDMRLPDRLGGPRRSRAAKRSSASQERTPNGEKYMTVIEEARTREKPTKAARKAAGRHKPLAERLARDARFIDFGRDGAV